jgi:hypothetical protein
MTTMRRMTMIKLFAKGFSDVGVDGPSAAARAEQAAIEAAEELQRTLEARLVRTEKSADYHRQRLALVGQAEAVAERIAELDVDYAAGV